MCTGKYLKLGLYDVSGALLDDVVFYMDPTQLTTAPYRAGALAGNTAQLGCPSAPGAVNFADGSLPVPGQDCWRAAGTNYGLRDTPAAESVSYVTIESSDNPPAAVL